jgi:nucleoredoxin
MSANLVNLFGETLLTKNGEKPTADVLQGKKYVGIYFSAHWCPPCRGFTPKLAVSYEESLQAKDLEIVFVSSDKDEKAFAEYFEEQPWVALPYSKRDKKDAISKKFKVQGIPTFVILDHEGALVCADARGEVSEDPEGEKFPWKPKSVTEILEAATVQNKEGKMIPFSSLKGQATGNGDPKGKGKGKGKESVVGLYFSAHWCPPCRGFTPELVKKYEAIKAAGKNFEIVFVSSDRSDKDFQEYFAEMPWLALKYADRNLKNELSKAFGVSGIPSLVLLDSDFSVITKNGRAAVMRDVEEFPFHDKPVADLATDTDGLNEFPCVMVLADKATADEQAKAYAALEPLAAEYKAAAKANDDDQEILFFLAKTAGGPVPRIRELCKVEASAAPQLILLDIPDNGGFYVGDAKQISTDGLRTWLSDYKASKLERKQLN